MDAREGGRDSCKESPHFLSAIRLLTVAGEFVYDFLQSIAESLGVYLSYVTY